MISRSLLIALCLALFVFFFLPLLALVVRTVDTGALGSWDHPIVYEALRLSLETTLATLCLSLVFGIPAAYVLARYSFPGKLLLDSLVDVPMVMPPAVAGVALLVAFGRVGLVGRYLDAAGLSIAFTTLAVVFAQLFIAAPFLVRAARAGFEAVDQDLELVAETLGVSRMAAFFRVTLPLAGPAVLGGAIMTWARALGEFGATIMFAGNFIGRTQTMPLAIYVAMERDLNAALALSVILVVVSFSVLALFKRVIAPVAVLNPHA